MEIYAVFENGGFGIISMDTDCIVAEGANFEKLTLRIHSLKTIKSWKFV